MKWVLPCPTGTETVLADELRALGVDDVEVGSTAVRACADLRAGYRMCLGSRVASRLLLPLAEWQGDDADAMYEALRSIAWWEHFSPSTTFAIGHSTHRRAPVPGHFAVQRAKDAVVDAFRDHAGRRPSIDKKAPELRLHVHVGETGGEISLDFSGSLHERGYRESGGGAPLKENLAAAILYLARWPAAAEKGQAFVDPTCGSGTFLVEAAWMALSIAPGMRRKRFGFEKWLKHDSRLFKDVRAALRAQEQPRSAARVYGFDASAQVLTSARRRLERAGVTTNVELHERAIAELEQPEERGVLVCNPPYGHRLGDEQTLFLFYQQLGDMLKRRFGGWTGYVFAAHNEQLKHLGLRPSARHVLYNGAIECRLLEFPLHVSASEGAEPAWRRPSEDAPMFVNRVKKNRKRMRSWSKQAGVDCYRIYDADIPEYNVAVDLYGARAVVHVYPTTATTDKSRARAQTDRLQDVVQTLPDALGIASDDVVVKVRRRHGEGDQYARLGSSGEVIVAHEGDLQFEINVDDRIDTGLFLDHRKVRQHALRNSSGKRVLNLFAYTCSVSVAAAAGGATVTSVDLSNTYLEWGRRNFKLNDLDPAKHRFMRADAVQWLARGRERFDWIFINPPTFSRSKKTSSDFQIHRDHVAMLAKAVTRLADGGEVLFTTHARDFELSPKLRERFSVKDMTHELVPPDFARSPFHAFQLRP